MKKLLTFTILLLSYNYAITGTLGEDSVLIKGVITSKLIKQNNKLTVTIVSDTIDFYPIIIKVDSIGSFSFKLPHRLKNEKYTYEYGVRYCSCGYCSNSWRTHKSIVKETKSNTIKLKFKKLKRSSTRTRGGPYY